MQPLERFYLLRRKYSADGVFARRIAQPNPSGDY